MLQMRLVEKETVENGGVCGWLVEVGMEGVSQPLGRLR